jgi:hypothetical protein
VTTGQDGVASWRSVELEKGLNTGRNIMGGLERKTEEKINLEIEEMNLVLMR